METGRGEYIGERYRVPKEATVTLPYKDFREMLDEMERLRTTVIRMGKERRAGK